MDAEAFALLMRVLEWECAMSEAEREIRLLTLRLAVANEQCARVRRERDEARAAAQEFYGDLWICYQCVSRFAKRDTLPAADLCDYGEKYPWLHEKADE